MSRTQMDSSSRSASRDTGGAFTLLVFVSIALILMVVVLSAYMRLAGSGLGCIGWPDCYARYEAIASASAPGPLRVAIPAWATLVHRLVATTLGALILAITYIAVRRRRTAGQSVMLPLLLFALTVLLSLLGYKTPSPLLPWVTMGNLMGGMTMLALLWWLGQRSVELPEITAEARRLRPWALTGLVLITLQIALGGWVSANFAALACATLPGCEGAGMPGAGTFNLLRELEATPAGAVIIGGDAKTIHMAHRASALIVFIYLCWLGARALAAGGPLRGNGIAILVLTLLQVTLGMLAVAFSLPLAVVTLHNATAALLLLAIVNLNHRLTGT